MSQEAGFELAGGPYAVTAARLALAEIGDLLDESQAFDVRLLVSELVTNAVQHAQVGPEDSIVKADDAHDEAREFAAARTLTVGDIKLDPGTREVTRSGQMVELTAVEFDLLEKLLRAAGRIITREELSKDVLGRSTSPFDRSIDMHISNLRKKLGHQAGLLERIKTVRGVGYIYTQASAADKRN